MDTHGWDVLAACRQDDLNKLLAKRMSQAPTSLSYSGSGVEIKGEFGPWQITSFGSDNTLTLMLPFKSGTLKQSGRFAVKPQVDLTGVKIEVSVQIDFVDNAKGTASDLKFQLKTVGKSKQDRTKGAVFVINPDLDGTLKAEDSSGTSATLLNEHIPQVLIANADKLSYALTSVNLVPTGERSWIKPVFKHFMFAQGAKDKHGHQEPGHLVVAIMVRDRPAASRSDKIDNALTDNSSGLNMAFAPDLFLEHFIMPSLPSSFQNPKHVLFKMKGDKIQMVLGAMPTPPYISTAAECKPVDHWGTGYTPWLFPMTIGIDDDVMSVHADGTFDITGLADSSVSFWFTQSLKPVFDAKSQSLKFKAFGETKSDYHKHIPAWIYIVSGVAALAVPLIVAAIITAIVDVVVAAVTTAVAKQAAGAGGQQTQLGNLADALVTWPGSEAVNISHAELETAFVVRGDVQM